MKNSLLLLALLLTTLSFAQNYKPGKVSKEELKETQDALFPDADAAILFREYKVQYDYSESKGFELSTTVFERIKIYNPDGFDWATKRIKIYNNKEDREKLGNLKAVTYNLVDGSVKKDKLKSAQIFEERINNYYVASTFTMPNIKSGSVIEIEYTIETPFTSIDDIDLQYSIPIKNLVVDVKVPDFYVYKTYPNPQAALAFSFKESDKNIEVVVRGNNGLGSADYGNFRDKNKNSDRGGSYQERRYHLEEVNIPPIKNEGFVDNLRNYQARSIWELTMVKNGNGVPKRYSTTWDAVTTSIYENDNFSNEIKKSDYYASDLAAATAGSETPEKKMAAIFSLVKQKVTWNGYKGMFPELGVKKAFKEGKGNAADINLMLVSMLQSVGLDASPVLVSTRNNGIPVYPTRSGFNYVIVHVSLNGKVYIMDATDSYSSIGLLPQRAMNWQGRLVKENGTSSWVALYPSSVSNKLTYIQAEITPAGAAIKVRERLSSHYAKEYRTANYKKTESSQLEDIDKNGEEVTFSNFKIKNLDNTSPNVTLSYEASSSSVVDAINGDLYVTPMLFFAQKENPFKEENRSYPLFFDFPKSHKYSITLIVPEGYKVTAVPESSKAALADNAVTYSYLISQQGGNVQLSVELAINKPALVPEDYQYIKGIFSQIVEKETEKIVLTKI